MLNHKTASTNQKLEKNNKAKKSSAFRFMYFYCSKFKITLTFTGGNKIKIQLHNVTIYKLIAFAF